MSEQREGPTTTFGYGLTRFAVYVSLRWEDKTKAILLPHHKALYVTNSRSVATEISAASVFLIVGLSAL